MAFCFNFYNLLLKFIILEKSKQIKKLDIWESPVLIYFDLFTNFNNFDDYLSYILSNLNYHIYQKLWIVYLF